MKPVILEIVGTHHHPPARTLLGVLPQGTPLTVLPEPSNSYDPNAKMVLLKTADIPDTSIAKINEAKLRSQYDMTIGDILFQKEWHLGYIPAVAAAHDDIRKITSEIHGHLTFVNNKPCVKWENPDA